MDLKYILKRSPGRRTISIAIASDNTVTVTAPPRATVAEIEKFIAQKRGWLEKHMRKNNDVNARFAPIIGERAVLVCGDIVPFEFGGGNSFTADKICATSYAALQKLFIARLGGRFLSLANKISEESGLKYAKISFRAYKSRWGCCNSKKEITFNYKLLMLPEDLWVYVIVHELSHTRYMNHSKAFWACVARVLPDYKKRVAELKSYSFLCPMY